MKKQQTLATALKADKKVDAKMGPKQIKADISSDKKNLSAKLKRK